MEELNIVDLIEHNPITKLSQSYNGKILNKIQQGFSNFEQQLFVSSFYCYLNYNSKTDFVVDLDNIWKWLGFQQKYHAKYLLEKQFIINNDYKIFAPDASGAKKEGRGGHNKENIMLTVKTFKSFCLKAGTKKADEIHEYYMKMEEIIHDVIQEESNELKMQLEQTHLQLEQKQNTINNHDKDKDILLEETILLQFPINTECIYYGKIDNISGGKELANLIKFGQSNNLSERIKCHKKNFLNFRLVAAFKVKNKIQIENAIKKHPILKKRLRMLTVENPNFKEENYRELLAIDNDKFSIEKIDIFIKEIIKENEYNIENYNLLVEKNELLEEQIRTSQQENKEKDEKIDKLTLELQNFTSDTTEYTKKKIASNYALCKYGYFLYAFECEPNKYKCSITRQKDFEILTTNLTNLDANGSMKYHVKVIYPFSEKIMTFMLKQSLTSLCANKYEGSYENIKQVLDIVVKLEKLLIDNGDNLEQLSNILDGDDYMQKQLYDPEEPKIHKAKRAIDQIDKNTGKVIATFASIEAAGRSLGLTTGTAVGIALREHRMCQGFLWRYAGVTAEQQYDAQSVIKICCDTGEKYCFQTIADAAKDANISAPGLRARILTKVHSGNHHWIFGNNASHYSPK